MMAAQLSCAGHECVAMHTAERALDEWRARGFDVVIADLRLPGLSGCELVECVLAEEFVPIIVVTGFLAEHRHRLCGISGLVVLEKPVEPARLLDAVRTSLARGCGAVPAATDARAMEAGATEVLGRPAYSASHVTGVGVD